MYGVTRHSTDSSQIAIVAGAEALRSYLSFFRVQYVLPLSQLLLLPARQKRTASFPVFEMLPSL